GEKLVGTSKATFTWGELLGDKNHQPLAVEMPEPTNELAEFISGSGAQLLFSNEFTWPSNSPGLSLSGQKNIYRRANGLIDGVIVFAFVWMPVNEPPRQFILVVRIRKGAILYLDEESEGYFS